MRRERDVKPRKKDGTKRSGFALVRPIRVADFEFIRDLSATVEGYTVPPLYILWMLARFHRDTCAIVEDGGQERVGYMLAINAGIRPDQIFIWQFATNHRGQRLRAGINLANHVKKFVKKRGIQRIVFTAVPDSIATEALRCLAKQVFDRALKMGARVPKSISATEREFHLLL